MQLSLNKTAFTHYHDDSNDVNFSLFKSRPRVKAFETYQDVDVYVTFYYPKIPPVTRWRFFEEFFSRGANALFDKFSLSAEVFPILITQSGILKQENSN